jgi:NAD(P)-dependent dehydrogenase (short-subunit alcohol dehydrogenase family)
MARVLITGSTTGLGLGAARELLDSGHEVVLHGRTRERAASVEDLARRASGVVIGDLSSARDTRRVANQVNAIGGIDAVIHNAAVYADARRIATLEGHAHILAINVLALYLLTAWITTRSSGVHEQPHARQRRHLVARSRLDGTDMERGPGLLRQQALPQHTRSRARPPMARLSRQRSRAGLGADQDGWPRRA